MNTCNIDSVLIQTYEAFDVPVDQFFGDQALTRHFVERVRERVGECDLNTVELMARLLNLRKRGKLPRLRRSYHGRKATSPIAHR